MNLLLMVLLLKKQKKFWVLITKSLMPLTTSQNSVPI